MRCGGKLWLCVMFGMTNIYVSLEAFKTYGIIHESIDSPENYKYEKEGEKQLSEKWFIEIYCHSEGEIERDEELEFTVNTVTYSNKQYIGVNMPWCM